MRWLRIAISLTVTLLTLLCMLPAQAAQGSGWAVLLDEQGDLQLSDIRSARYTNQFSPIELDRLTAAEPDGALWLRFKPGTGQARTGAAFVRARPVASFNMYVLDGDKLIDQSQHRQRPAPGRTPTAQQRLHAAPAAKRQAPGRLPATGLRPPVAALHHPAIGGHRALPTRTRR